MKTLIVNADDFGLAPGVNRGIVEAAERGVVTSTSVMVMAPHIDHAMDLIRASQVKLGLGLHVVLNGRLPTFTGSPLFTSPHGYLPVDKWDMSDEPAFVDAIGAEIRHQFVRFEAITGQRPDHMDSHHNVCFANALLKRVTLGLLKEYRVPIRNPAKRSWLSGGAEDSLESELRTAGVRVARTIRDFRGDGVNEATLEHILINVAEDTKYELMCHVGYVDDSLDSSYKSEREDELRILTSPRTIARIRDLGIELTTYAEAFATD